MRTNIVIDDKLMTEALEATGAKTKKEVVELGLGTLIGLKRQERIREFRGKRQWTGDLDEIAARLVILVDTSVRSTIRAVVKHLRLRNALHAN